MHPHAKERIEEFFLDAAPVRKHFHVVFIREHIPTSHAGSCRPHGHEPVLHVGLKSVPGMHPHAKERIEEFFLDAAPVRKHFHVVFIREHIPTSHAGSCRPR